MDDSQSELFPHASPESLLGYCRRLEARILAIAPELEREDCWAVLGQLAITHLVFDKIDFRIRAGAAWQRRASLPQLPVAAPLEPVHSPWRRSRAAPVTYRPRGS